MHSCGILLHISSLPSDYGIGTLGREAFKFVDFLKKSGQEYWQILPIGPTGFGDSPYQSYSAYAGNPLLIDLDKLIDRELVAYDDHDLQVLKHKQHFADYAQLFSFKYVILQKAAANFFANATTEDMLNFKRFCSENNFWLEDYALFMSLKYINKQKMWTEWDDDIRLRKPKAIELTTIELTDDILCWKFIQYEFFRQYFALKDYANENGIKIYGDMPIYVSMDSCDIWANPELFMLDEDCRPTMVAGCPPDGFSPTGQLWGNPLYNWDKMSEDGFSWWISRVEYSSKLFDLTRIDHFRGFESFYAIPAQNKTAENGEWLKGPSVGLFDAIKAELGDVKLVAEDLGFLTENVRKMLKETGYPGMNVLEFAFYGRENSSYLPHNYVRNSVTYIGTHDNDTALGWYDSLEKHDRKFAKKYMGLSKKEGVCGGLIRTVMSSVSDLVIIQMQDYLELGTEARMNIPSTIGGKNWAWRLKKSDLSSELAKRIGKYAKTYFRAPEEKKINNSAGLNDEESSAEASVKENKSIAAEEKSPIKLSEQTAAEFTKDAAAEFAEEDTTELTEEVQTEIAEVLPDEFAKVNTFEVEKGIPLEITKETPIEFTQENLLCVEEETPDETAEETASEYTEENPAEPVEETPIRYGEMTPIEFAEDRPEQNIPLKNSLSAEELRKLIEDEVNSVMNDGASMSEYRQDEEEKPKISF